jgi:hypothetical protein
VAQALSDIDEHVHDLKAKLMRLAGLFQDTFDAGNRICLCAMVTAKCFALDPGSGRSFDSRSRTMIVQ